VLICNLVALLLLWQHKDNSMQPFCIPCFALKYRPCRAKRGYLIIYLGDARECTLHICHPPVDADPALIAFSRFPPTWE
jgi:hypothetical protein